MIIIRDCSRILIHNKFDISLVALGILFMCEGFRKLSTILAKFEWLRQ